MLSIILFTKFPFRCLFVSPPEPFKPFQGIFPHIRRQQWTPFPLLCAGVLLLCHCVFDAKE